MRHTYIYIYIYVYIYIYISYVYVTPIERENQQEMGLVTDKFCREFTTKRSEHGTNKDGELSKQMLVSFGDQWGPSGND